LDPSRQDLCGKDNLHITAFIMVASIENDKQQHKKHFLFHVIKLHRIVTKTVLTGANQGLAFPGRNN